MRDRRVTEQEATRVPASDPGVGKWVLVIVAICALWLIGMVVVSHYSLEHKSPARIQNWTPDPGTQR